MPRFLDINTSVSITSCSFLAAALATQSETTRRVSQRERERVTDFDSVTIHSHQLCFYVFSHYISNRSGIYGRGLDDQISLLVIQSDRYTDKRRDCIPQ